LGDAGTANFIVEQIEDSLGEVAGRFRDLEVLAGSCIEAFGTEGGGNDRGTGGPGFEDFEACTGAGEERDDGET